MNALVRMSWFTSRPASGGHWMAVTHIYGNTYNGESGAPLSNGSTSAPLRLHVSSTQETLLQTGGGSGAPTKIRYFFFLFLYKLL